jgi:hypothetical protein
MVERMPSCQVAMSNAMWVYTDLREDLRKSPYRHTEEAVSAIVARPVADKLRGIA